MARQPVLSTPRGEIRPACCRSDNFGLPPGPHRIDERHVGIRFGDRKSDTGDWHILLNGVDVTEGCVEAYAGDDGWIAVYDQDVTGNQYLCPFGGREILRRHYLIVKKWGRVDVVRLPVIRPV